MSVVGAFILRDLRNLRTYRLQLLGQAAGMLFAIMSIVFLSRIVPGRQVALKPFGSDYFTFVLIGTGAATFFQTGLGTFSDSLGREQAQGTLEALLVTPNDSRLLLLAGAAWPFLFAALTLAFYLAAGALFFGAHVPLVRVPLLVVILVLSLAAFSALGVLAAAVLIQTKRGTIVLGLVAGTFALFGGVFYPISVLPGWLRWVGHALPITYGIDGSRRALVTPVDVGAVISDVVALVTFTAVVLPAALVIVNWSLDKARRDGSLSQY
jgi:ABC-2 type transport system permease protein